MVQRGSKLFRSLFRRQDRKRDRPLQRRPLLLESLEDRRLLTTFTVTNTADAGPGSLRQAILDANVMPNDPAIGPDQIAFQIDSPGPHTIQPRFDLPIIQEPVIIDGSTQPGFEGTPVIELDGSQLPSDALGTGITLDSGSDGSTIRALAINQFSVAGIFIGSNRNVVEGNFIGTDITGTIARANGEGVLVVLAQQNRIGGAMSAEQNLIAFNNGAGVRMDAPASDNHIQRNSIHSNGGLGIDLNNDGVTLNDPGDGDTGPNNLQNFPVITALTVNNGTTAIEGTINSTRNTPFMLEFFRNDASDPSGFGEGQAFIGETLVTTDPTGNISFTVDFLRDLKVGEFVTATATDQGGNTSEFSAAFQNTNNPPPVNQSPVLGAVGAKSIDELATLSFTATAGDVDIPANGLIFSLSGAVPSGASITSAGAFSWTPTAAQGPGVFSFDVVVTDDGSPNLSDRETITITVNDSGTLTVDDVNVVEGGGLTFTVKLDNAVQGGFTVDVTLADVTATGGATPLVFPTDFNNVVARLNFSGTAGEIQQFTVATLDDAVVELTETFMVSLSASNPLVDDTDTATGTIVDNDLLLVEFNQSTGMDAESAGGNLPQLLVTGTIQERHSATVNLFVVDATATGGGVDYTALTSVTVPAGTYNATAVAVTGLLSVTPDTLIESDESIDLGMLTGSQVQVGDANGDGTIQATTRYTIIDDEMPRTAVAPDSPTKLTIRDVVPGGKADRLDLTIVNGMLVITDLNNLIGDYFDNTTGSTVDVPLASILSIEIDLLEGDDQLSIDFSAAPPGFNTSVTINGGGGHDTLTFTGPTPLGSGDLTTNDEVDDIFVNAPITTQGGSVTLKAMRDLELNASIDTGTGGSVNLSANGHDIFGNCSLIQAGDADVHLTAGTGIAGVRVQTTGDVTLDAGSGGIAGCAGPLAVTARTLTVVANASVGSALLISGRVTNVEPLLTNVDTIEGLVGGLGMFLVNDGPLTDNVVLVDTAPLGIRDVRVLPPSDAPDGEGSPPQNAANRFDVNGDGAVSPVDALAVVNYLNSLASGVQAEGSSHPRVRLYVDVNGDRAASALDALLVINYLNARTANFAEGESMGAGHEHAAGHAGQVLSSEAASSDAGLHEQSRRRASAELPNPRRSNDLFATPPSVLETSHSTSRPARTLLKDEHATSEFESLLATIAEDTAAAWFA